MELPVPEAVKVRPVRVAGEGLELVIESWIAGTLEAPGNWVELPGLAPPRET